jgi:hypothetical protein
MQQLHFPKSQRRAAENTDSAPQKLNACLSQTSYAQQHDRLENVALDASIWPYACVLSPTLARVIVHIDYLHIAIC